MWTYDQKFKKEIVRRWDSFGILLTTNKNMFHIFSEVFLWKSYWNQEVKDANNYPNILIDLSKSQNLSKYDVKSHQNLSNKSNYLTS